MSCAPWPRTGSRNRRRGWLRRTGKLRVDVDELAADLLTLAGHEFNAPKGVGALYVRAGTLLRAVLHGADQEQRLRPGTENVALIVALGAAAALAAASLPDLTLQLIALRDRLHTQLVAGVPGLQLNGHVQHRLPNTLHVSFPGISRRTLLGQVSDAVAASVGSACHSEHDAVSGVLAAMGLDAARARGAVRLSVGRTTRADDVVHAAAAPFFPPGLAWHDLDHGERRLAGQTMNAPA